MNVRYIDTHCHLQLGQYEHDREELIEKMRAEDIIAIVVGDDYESSQMAVALAEKHERLFASVGVHPDHVKDFVNPSSDDGFTKSIIHELAKHPKVVAIGECGFDFYRFPANEATYSAEATKAKQKELFKKHIALAAVLDKPLIIHARSSKGTSDAYQDLIEILKEAKKEYPNLRGVIHFFAGGVAEAKEFFALGFSISFTAVITFSHDYDAVIRAVPLANILSETDAPYVAPASRRGQRNDPLAVIDVVNKIAEIRGEDPELVRQTLLANAKRLFVI
ncbi:MAG: TatD family hydrolase [Candidatus Kaiserbacteria bacterium]|nr:TatD family hydrolase [Candidatus Kaiserbacteria bacterium]